ncbi:dTDP-4-dehydrorhamnose reductase family protein [Vogesella mureinivorans]|uniref:dTDP-4-dehydrorhamnose reductase family protein n=1 Tax=Vogesella mureinivorans TaxID=657276 RepID=UPI00197E9EDD|nr:SDR family oxidoreductase [Vogesella mureinivorans]
MVLLVGDIMSSNYKVLVLGASGMLGNAVFRFFSDSTGFDTYGTIRSRKSLSFFAADLQNQLISDVDVENADNLIAIMHRVKPDLVINCVGLVKQLAQANDVLSSIPINAMLPHRLAGICALIGARLVHMSTDCVFSGAKGNYQESDFPDCYDLYGRSKLIGEVDYENAVTLRTSIIGHEIFGSRSLVDWFLSQNGQVKGFTKTIFSGLPTVEVARIIRDFVVPNVELRGLYHLSSNPISKYDLLSLIADCYGKNISILPDPSLVLDRSLNSERFRSATGFRPESWAELVLRMYNFH